MDIPELLTPNEVARIFKKSVQWVYRNQIILGGFKIDKHKERGAVFFTADSINRAIKAGQEEAINEIERWENFRMEQKRSKRVGSQYKERTEEEWRELYEKAGFGDVLS